MRISVDERDPGFIRDATLFRVFLDGRAVDGVITADDSLGEVLCVDRDGGGRVIVAPSGIEVKVKTLNGAVQIEKLAS